MSVGLPKEPSCRCRFAAVLSAMSRSCNVTDASSKDTAASALREHVTKALEQTPAIVLDLRGVHFIDSSGLGVLVRILARTGHDNLKLCGLTGRVSETLKITRLSTVFDSHESEVEAIAAFYRQSPAANRPSRIRGPHRALRRQIRRPADLYARGAAAGRIQCDDLGQPARRGDAAQGDQTKVVLVAGDMRAAGTTGTVETFNRLLERVSVVDVPADFAQEDPNDTGPRLIEQVRGLIGHA